MLWQIFCVVAADNPSKSEIGLYGPVLGLKIDSVCVVLCIAAKLAAAQRRR